MKSNQVQLQGLVEQVGVWTYEKPGHADRSVMTVHSRDRRDSARYKHKSVVDACIGKSVTDEACPDGHVAACLTGAAHVIV